MFRLIAYVQDGVQRFPLAGNELLIGSQPECDICLPYTGVAQRHARIWRDGDGVRIEDLGSRRGVLVNGQRVRETGLQLLDEIRLGTITLLLDDVVPGGGEPKPSRREAAPIQATVRVTSGLLSGHLESVSRWVLSGTESRAALDSRLRDVLTDFGGGIWFLYQGSLEEPGIQFVVSTEVEWLRQGDSVLEQVRSHQAQQKSEEDTAGFRGELGGRPAWIFYRFSRAASRECFSVGAFALYQPGEWSPVAPLSVLSDLLVLGLVHQVGRQEAILPSPGGRQQELTLAPGLIVGSSKEMSQVIERLSSVVDPSIHVLLRGETGSGRELLARSLHLSSTRRAGPFVVAPCEGGKAHEIDADLFGAEVPGKDAPVRRDGKIHMAHGGTLLIQDIEHLPLTLQAKLVRFLRSGEVEVPGGGTQSVSTRIIASSRGPLEPYVSRDQFRVDLAYRLFQFAIDVPALRDRREDLPLLLRWHIDRFCLALGKQVQGITVKVMEALMAYDFPGNLPELENIARQLVLLCPAGRPIEMNLLPGEVRTSSIRAATPISANSELDLDRLVSACEQAAIREALQRTHGNKSQAARLLGLSRNGLAMKMRRYGLQA